MPAIAGFSKHQYDKKPVLSFYEKGPGPAGYYLPPLVGRKGHGLTHRINPEYTFGTKITDLRRDLGPGPAYLIPQHLKTNGYFAGFKYTCRPKFPILDKRLMLPAPNNYRLPPTDKYRPRAPTCYLGSRTPLINKRLSPGPNAYLLPPAIGPKIPDKLAAAECTLKGDRKTKDLPMSPGPIYNIGIPWRGPAFTIRRKFKELQSGYNAGPASYTPLYPPPCPCKTPPRGCSLSYRYNDFTGIFRTPCDGSQYEPEV